jgi:hypothetical protein
VQGYSDDSGEEEAKTLPQISSCELVFLLIVNAHASLILDKRKRSSN